MKKLLLLALAAFVVSCNSTQTTVSNDSSPKKEDLVSPTTYASSITEAELKTHLYIYASDEFEGRETGKPGQKKAVEYIKSYYQKIGVPAAKSDGNYFQSVPLEQTETPAGSFTVDGKTYKNGSDFISLSSFMAKNPTIVSVNFGIENDKYSDYTSIDVKGKVVIINAGEPKNDDGTYTITGTKEKSKWSVNRRSISTKLELAKEKGAIAVLYIDKDNFGAMKKRYEYMKKRSGRLSVNTGDDKDKFTYIFIKNELKDKFLNAASTSFDIEKKSSTVMSENVAAIIKGSEKPNEYLIISSHLDHIGVEDNGEINNGADDDGSGTVAMLEIADAFKKAADAGNGPKRSIVFLHVTGEEKGLLGSQYYADVDPIFPLANTVADLNIDMVGRIDPERKGDRNYVYLIGSDKLSTDLHNISEEVNKKYTNIELDYKFNDENDPNRFYYRSDHYNFAKNNIPIIFYFNGTHADYHKVGDTPDKINYDLLENRTKLVFYTAWEVANRAKRVVVDKPIKK